jgi:hypothetical protein
MDFKHAWLDGRFNLVPSKCTQYGFDMDLTDGELSFERGRLTSEVRGTVEILGKNFPYVERITGPRQH